MPIPTYITVCSTSPIDTFWYLQYQSPPPPPPALQTTDIIAGEITAWRVWLVEGGLTLRSVAMYNLWLPGIPMRGDPSRYREGVYSYKTKEELFRHYGVHKIVAYGEVEIWGDVVEHRLGYRAEFARIKSIYHRYPKVQRALRKRYGIKDNEQSWWGKLFG